MKERNESAEGDGHSPNVPPRVALRSNPAQWADDELLTLVEAASLCWARRSADHDKPSQCDPPRTVGVCGDRRKIPYDQDGHCGDVSLPSRYGRLERGGRGVGRRGQCAAARRRSPSASLRKTSEGLKRSACFVIASFPVELISFHF